MDDFPKCSHMGIHSSMYDNSTALGRMQQQYWTTKQVVLRKLGKKEDDCVIASDLELDLKLKVFQMIEESFLSLMRVLENYQDRLCSLAQEENALGRFLKENGKQDKTKAGKAMISTGKALSYSAQQRLSLRIPLVRLYEEVETFHYQAIIDTLKTVEKMEKSRSAYRGTLMWMKDVSQQLDPDTCKQMEKFRKVQRQVKKSKQGFDKLKLDTLQKVDLLSFSRCNLFSQSLAAYQNSLININRKIAFTTNSEAISTKQNNQFEFSVLKELKDETPMKLDKDDIDMQSFQAEDKDSTKKELGSRKNEAKQADSRDLLNDVSPGNAEDELLSLNNVFDTSMNRSKVISEMNFLSEWDAVFGDEKTVTGNATSPTNDSTGKMNSLPSFLPSQLLNISRDEVQGGIEGNLGTSLLSSQMVSSSTMSSNTVNSTGISSSSNRGNRDMSAWFNLFADLDPLANPDMIGEKKENITDRSC